MPVGSHRFTSRGGDRAQLPVEIRLGGSVLARAPPVDGRRDHPRVSAPAFFFPLTLFRPPEPQGGSAGTPVLADRRVAGAGEPDTRHSSGKDVTPGARDLRL